MKVKTCTRSCYNSYVYTNNNTIKYAEETSIYITQACWLRKEVEVDGIVVPFLAKARDLFLLIHIKTHLWSIFQTGWGQPNLQLNGRWPFREGKATTAWSWPTTLPPSSPNVNESSPIFSPYMPSWKKQGHFNQWNRSTILHFWLNITRHSAKQLTRAMAEHSLFLQCDNVD